MSSPVFLPPTHLFKPGGLTTCGLPTNNPTFPVIISDQPTSITCPLCVAVTEFETAEAAK